MNVSKKNNIGLAMAGGGPAGAIYEIGVIRALEEAIEGLSFNDFSVYVGVSAGAFITANLANNITTDVMCRAIVGTDPDDHPFVPETFLTPAFGEFARSASNIPQFIFDAVRDYLGNREDRTILKSLTRLSRAIPVGLFDNRPIRRYLERIYTKGDRTNDFNKLKTKLHVVTADLDSGDAVIFGKDRMDIPISQAVQASSALPGLYPPVLIDGRFYVDGVLLKTLHASTILDSGVDLAICINPIVPVDTKTSVEMGYMKRGKLIDRGMPSILSQTFRTLIHSRMITGFTAYKERYKDSDIILFEPSKEDYRMFFTNIFSFSSRKAVCEHAYESTYKNLYKRREELAPILAKHGYRLKTEILQNPNLNLWKSVNLPEKIRKKFTRKKRATDNLNDALARIEQMLAEKQASETKKQDVGG